MGGVTTVVAQLELQMYTAARLNYADDTFSNLIIMDAEAFLAASLRDNNFNGTVWPSNWRGRGGSRGTSLAEDVARP